MAFRLIFQQHSTFFVQTLFFGLVLLENIVLSSTPLFLTNNQDTNRALVCLGQEKVIHLIGIIIMISIGSWICHTMYYKQLGHPWADINGPEIGKGKFGFSIHHCGTERMLMCVCGRNKKIKNHRHSLTQNHDKRNMVSIEICYFKFYGIILALLCLIGPILFYVYLDFT